MFTVLGITAEDLAEADPTRRLSGMLDAQFANARPAGPALRAIAYAVDGTDAILSALREKYAQQGEFSQFYYFNEAAMQACRRFDIALRELEVINEQEVPAARANLLDRIYDPAE